MSFYGNVIYELADAFASVIVKNSGKGNKAFAASSQDATEVAAAGLGGKATLDTGNQWVGLTADTDNQVIKVWHSEPDESSTNGPIAAVTKVSAPAADNVDLSSGDYIQISQATYDDAGHINGQKVATLKMPVSKTEENISDLQNRMAEIEESQTEQITRIDAVAEEFGDMKDTQESLNSRIKENTDGITAINSDTIGNMKYVSGYGTTIATLMGADLYGHLKSLNTNDISIKGGLTAINSTANEAVSTANSISLAVHTVIEKLCEQITSQLAEQDITIELDPDSLWKVD